MTSIINHIRFLVVYIEISQRHSSIIELYIQ